MADVIKDLTTILTDWADNTTGDITPQRGRDMIVSLHGVFGDMRVETGVTAQGSLTSTPAKMTGWTTDGVAVGTTPDSTTNKRIVVGTAGTYWVEFHISFTGTASETFTFEIYKDGVATGIAGIIDANATPDAMHVTAGGHVVMAATNYFEVFVNVATAGSITPTEAQLCCHRRA